jgi:formate dehydrogenase major subunit
VFGWDGYARGDIANVLLAIHGDPNTSIHSTKALTCALRKGRLSQPTLAQGTQVRETAP